MDTLFVHLFGQFRMRSNNSEDYRLKPGKAQELLAYLLLQHPRIHSRETLASLLWNQVSTTQALKNLRHTLWQVRGFLETTVGPDLLEIDGERVSIKRDVSLWLDVATFKQIADQTGGVTSQALSQAQFADLEYAVQLYNADLLEGWYQDWCIYEREYFQRIVLILLDKLIEHCREQHQYENGIFYGERILRYDCAHERTHRGLMHLYYLLGDRTAALRQYQRCCDALQKELGVEPSSSTRVLYDQLCADRLQEHAVGAALPALNPPLAGDISQAVADVLERLQQIHNLLSKVR
jgi:DNA-binding SARP family transcriptional activator